MSDDEILITCLSFIAAAACWIHWYYFAVRRRFVVDAGASKIAVAAPLLCAVSLLAVLLTLSADDVRRDPKYILLYLLLGAAWIGAWSKFFGTFGLSLRHDVAERHNRAAAIALAGALLALTLCFAGGNIGNGPGWWVVAVCAALSSGALFVLWMAIEWATGVSEAVTVDRDVAAALRLAGLLIAIGVILGRAVAGDWFSLDATVADFWRAGWPAALVAGAGIVVEKFVPRAPGLLTLLAYLSAAVLYVAVYLPRP